MTGKIFIASTNGYCDLIIFTSLGKVIRFHEGEVRVTDRKNKGVKAFRLEETETVTGITTAKRFTQIEDYTLAIVDEYGNIKRIDINDIPITCRAGKGIKI